MEWVADGAAQLAHAADPAVIVGGLVLAVLLHFGVRQDHETLLREALHHRLGHIRRAENAINAGGVISIALATPGGNDTLVREKTLAIGKTLTTIFERAEKGGTTPERVADRMAEERLESARRM